jgi:predicted DNA-binding WGR domain protein
MPRYEFSDGKSNKFWEIELDGKSFTTTYGRIGTDGQATTKDWKTEAEASKQYEKLIAEKTGKGYTLVGGGGGGGGDEDEDEAAADE